MEQKKENAKAFLHWCTISQSAKISHPSTRLSIFQFFLLFFLLFLICNAEFDLNSTCLDRLDKFDINSLQKL